MLRFHRFLGRLVATSVIGFGCLAHGQNAADPQQVQAAPDAQVAAVQPAQDPDTANQIQQLQAAIDQLQQQVSRLTTAVEELQADRTESVKAAPAPKSKGKAPVASKKAVAVASAPVSTVPEADATPLTVLVFQDGHRTEARNYAIVGQTLWIYTEQDSKKVPLADLDVTATKSANADRGIAFQIPNTK
jgi:peptidoglycan hydrolase CwlO-like protein